MVYPLYPTLGNQRSHYKNYVPFKDSTILKRLFMVTSIACFSRKKNPVNFFPVLLGVYMLGTGTKRRVLEILAGLGRCPSYTYFNTMNRNRNEFKVANYNSPELAS